MPTILERFEKLGLAKNKSILSWAGEHVSHEFCKRNLHGRTLKDQQEGEEIFSVWNYPDEWTKEMDAIILKIIYRG